MLNSKYNNIFLSFLFLWFLSLLCCTGEHIDWQKCDQKIDFLRAKLQRQSRSGGYCLYLYNIRTLIQGYYIGRGTANVLRMQRFERVFDG